MMRRASSISILSGLGVQDPERILEPFSPTQMYGGPPDTPTTHAYAQAQVQPPTPDAYDSYGSYAPYPPEVPPKVQAGAAFPTASPTPPGKLSHFPGQRPPSELVTTHMAAYFPGAEKKVLERARRMSMLKPHTSMLGGKRDSVASFATGTGVGTMGSGGGMGGRPNPRFSRFSVSTQGSVPRPNSPRGSTISGISGMSNEGMAPRVSLSTDDGQSLDLQPAYSSGGDTDSLSAERDRRSESRQSMYSQYRTKKDKEKKDVSDTASLMTVDQITAEVVESRRASTLLEPESTSSDEWTKVSVGGESEETLTPSDSNGNSESTDEEEDEEEEEEDWAEGSRWIKGALIGAGAFGQVYLGMDAETGILMAVKQVELPRDSTPNAERKKAMLTALEHEIALLEEFRHQHIVQYLRGLHSHANIGCVY
jgi:mitogen-activated protein kinase kinase kinase